METNFFKSYVHGKKIIIKNHFNFFKCISITKTKEEKEKSENSLVLQILKQKDAKF